MQLVFCYIGVFCCFLAFLFVFLEIGNGDGCEVEVVGGEGCLEAINQGNYCVSHFVVFYEERMLRSCTSVSLHCG